MRVRERTLLADLRRQIERLDGGYRSTAILPFGLACMDFHLQDGKGLALGALHEVSEAGAASAEFAGASTLFVAGIAARLEGPVLWCLNRRDLFAPGLAGVGLHPDRVIYAETFRERDILSIMEEGAREKGLAAVIGEVTRLGLTASRRLQLAAEKSGVPVFALRRWWTQAERDLTTLPNGAVTRWRIAPHSSPAPPAPGLGRPHWRVELLRCRGGTSHSWILEACDETGHLALPANLANRPHPAPVRRTATHPAVRHDQDGRIAQAGGLR